LLNIYFAWRGVDAKAMIMMWWWRWWGLKFEKFGVTKSLPQGNSSVSYLGKQSAKYTGASKKQENAENLSMPDGLHVRM
jgi:hypothetical protein